MAIGTTNLSDLYSHYRGKLDVRQVLEHYGAQNVSETVSSDGTTELVHSCILDHVEPHHANGDQHPSAWANVEKGLYCCSVYWSGDVFHLIQKMEGTDTFNEVAPMLSDFFIGGTRSAVNFRKDLDKIFTESSSYSVSIPRYSERVLDAWRGDVQHPYLFAQRGISHEAIGLLKLGWDRRENRIVFPHFWDGNLVGWQKRSIPRVASGLDWQWKCTLNQWPKYKNSTGFPKSETLYAHDLARGCYPDEVVVVESPMSVAKAYSLGTLKPSPVATFGAKVSKRQIELLREFDRVIVWFDDDTAGINGCYKIVSSLYRHTEVLVVTPDKGKDLGDCQSREEVEAKLNTAIAAPLWLAINTPEA